MAEYQKGRMLLSHNFNISSDIAPELSREEFTEIFISGLSSCNDITCSQINNPHWIVEVLFDSQKRTAAQVGELCAEALSNKRRSHLYEKLSQPTISLESSQKKSDSTYDILALGGVKTTPAISSSLTSLQQGEWGVDVVETPDRDLFLQGLGWEVVIASKPPENVFKIELTVGD
ncbi:MAG: DUF2656 domain-containing protein [Cyanobacteria bacterium P01_A01_bin.84]